MALVCGSVDQCLPEFFSLVRSVFGATREGSLDYTPKFLTSCIDYPGTSLSLSPAWFADGVMVSCLASLPRRVRLYGRDLNLALLTLNAVSRDFRAFGLGIDMGVDAVRRARASGFDGAIFYCVDGAAANRTGVAAMKAAGVPCGHVFTIDYMAGLPRSVQSNDDIRDVVDPELLVKASEGLLHAVPLVRVWDREEAAWQIGRSGGLGVSLESGRAAGLIAGYVVNDTRGTPCAQIDDVLWGELDDADRQRLVLALLDRAASKGARIILLPLLNYTDIEPFRRAGFRRFARRVNAYLTLWNGSGTPDRVDSMYLDVM
jgi:hypothetical protein